MYPNIVLDEVEKAINAITDPAIKCWRSAKGRIDDNQRDSMPCALVVDDGGNSKGETSGQDVNFNFSVRCITDVSSDGQGRESQDLLLGTYFQKIKEAVVGGVKQGTMILQGVIRLAGWGKVTPYDTKGNKFLYYCDYRFIINLNLAS